MKVLVNQRYKNLFPAQGFTVKAFIKFIHFLFFLISLKGSKALRPSLWSDVVTKTVDKLPVVRGGGGGGAYLGHFLLGMCHWPL